MADLGSSSLTLDIAGGLTSAVGGFYAAKSAQSKLRLQSYLAGMNARMAELGAQSSLNQGQQQVASLTTKVGQMEGTQRANLAANGVDMGTGSAAEIQASTELMKQNDIDTITANAVRTAWGYRVQGANYSNEAMMDNASASGINPTAMAATSLIGSASGVAKNWYTLNKSGALNGSIYQVK